MTTSSPPPGHLTLWRETLVTLAAIVAGRACAYPPDHAFISGRNPRSTPEGRRETVAILLAAQRPAFEAAWRSLSREEQQVLRDADIFTPPTPPVARGVLRVVACGYEEVATGRFIGAEALPAYLAEEAATKARFAGGTKATEPASTHTPPIFGQPPPRAAKRPARARARRP